MTMTGDILSPCSDIVFRMLFGDARNLDVLRSFLRAALPLPRDDYDELTLQDPFLFSAKHDDKASVLDVEAKTKSGKVIDIEIQVANHAAIHARVLYYLSKIVAKQLKEGGSYKRIKPSISIFITDFVLLPEEEDYYNDYVFINRKTGRIFSDLMEIHTLELPKLPPETDNTSLWAWMRFLKSRTKEELEMLAQRHTELAPAAKKLIDLSANDKAWALYEARLKAERDRIAREEFVREESREEGLKEGLKEGQLTIARKALRRNMPVEDIAALTGLSPEEIRALQNA
ncbi:MAG: Rpn family recombination-promoting nuclease/putative transposase [Candidatus Accumulibacter sp.]|nr:Rpn family recombination-promoting nuclease/putative transposase [Accumulibacter sp.]